jgi:pullulanase/glycogen debranching enzyme
VPMITAGDERGRTQRGNNNAYCQDNEISWVDWRPDDAWLDVYEVTKTALRLRREHPVLRQRHWFEGRPTIVGGPKDIVWLHPTGREMTDQDWADESLRSVGAFVSGAPLRSPGPHGEQQIDNSFVLWFNAAAAPLEVTLPANDWVQLGEVVLSTDTAHPAGATVRAGATLTLGPKTVLVVLSS